MKGEVCFEHPGTGTVLPMTTTLSAVNPQAERASRRAVKVCVTMGKSESLACVSVNMLGARVRTAPDSESE